jgi:hypothetical protein
MLDALCGGDERRVQDLTTLCVVEAASRIFDEGRHCAARRRTGRFVQLLEKQVQTLDLNPGFGVMLVEHAVKSRRRRAAGHYRELGSDLLFRVEQIVQL